MYALLGPIGVGLLVAAYMARDVSGFKVAMFGGLGLVCLVSLIVMTPATKGGGNDCFIDWDARSNRTVCN